MSLQDIKVGDEVVVPAWRSRSAERYPVTAVGRKYITAGGEQFAIADGQRKGPVHGSALRAYSLAQWTRREADDALRETIRKLGNHFSFAALSDEEVRDITVTLQGVAERLEKK